MNSSDQAILANQLPISVEIDREEDIYDILSQLYKRIANAVNNKEGSLYSLQEIYSFNQLLSTLNSSTNSVSTNNRNIYRKTFDVVALNGGPIGGGATVTFAHNITGLFESWMIYANCTSATPQYFTVVYPDAFLDNTNLNFTNPLPATAINKCKLVAEYLKN